MSYFKVKLHQIRFRLGLSPRPRWGSSERSPGLLAGFKWILLLMEGYGEGMEKGDKRGRVEKNEGEGGRVRHGFVGWTPLD